MNKTEKLGYEWLKTQGFKGIIFQGNKSPDFLTEEKNYEVKRAYTLKTGQYKILFQPNQRKKLKQTNSSVLVFNEKSTEPLEILNPEELDNNFIRNVILHDIQYKKAKITHTIDRGLLEEVVKLRDEKYPNLSRSEMIEMLIERAFSTGKDIAIAG